MVKASYCGNSGWARFESSFSQKSFLHFFPTKINTVQACIPCFSRTCCSCISIFVSPPLLIVANLPWFLFENMIVKVQEISLTDTEYILTNNSKFVVDVTSRGCVIIQFNFPTRSALVNKTKHY